MKSKRLTRDSVPDDFSVKLALVDAIPVVFFGVDAMLVYPYFPHLLFLAGAVVATISGLVKVLWKLIVATKRKNIWPMFIQMRIVMPIGFLMMIASAICYRQDVHMKAILVAVTKFPAVVFFAVGVLGMLSMFVFAFALSNRSRKANWLEQLVNVVAQICFFIGLLLI